MSILAAVSNSNVRVGIRAVISALEKMGKTTLSCNAPRPLLIPLEQGFANVVVNRVPMLEHFDYVMQLMDEIAGQAAQRQFPYMSLVFDSITAMERLIHQKVLESDPNYGKGNKKALTMEAALGGYGKAYQFANELFGNFLAKCDDLATKYGINIIFTAHVFAAEVVDPNAGVYNTWDILLHSPKNQKTYGKREMLTQWADIIAHLHEPLTVIEGKQMNTAISKGQGRMLGLTRTTGYVAGNRFGANNVLSIPPVNGWNVLAHELYTVTQGRIDVYNRDVVA
jgi:hypothetical protein